MEQLCAKSLPNTACLRHVSSKYRSCESAQPRFIVRAALSHVSRTLDSKPDLCLAVRRCHKRRRPLAVKGTAVDMPQTVTKPKTVTERIFEELERRQEQVQQAGGAGGGTTYKALKGADAAWAKLRNMQAQDRPAPQFVREDPSPLPGTAQFDVVVCGGTLGVFLAVALQQRGLSVAVVERGPLRGRQQEWNISRKELYELAKEGLLTPDELEECVNIEFNPVRVGFHGAPEVWTQDVLNLGVSPVKLIAKVRERFEQAGGMVYEFAAVEGVTVHPNAVALALPDGYHEPSANGASGSTAHAGNGAAAAASNGSGQPHSIMGRLLLDCMGNFSPIVRQARWGQKPDGICMVVGSCGRGFPHNTTADIIRTVTDIQPPDAAVSDLQYFWEAFPAADDGEGTTRTIYMFSYLDADPSRPSLEALLEDYWRLMPQDQGVRLEDIEVQRILFGFFPTYRASPLRPPFHRTLQIGDASGIQSPLSFGGFGALMRHLPRLRSAICEALEVDMLSKESLALINAYNPGLSGAWMLQRAMSLRPGKPAPSPRFINTLLGNNFQAMQRRGDRALKPFLQDVIQFGPLAMTLLSQMIFQPLFTPQILRHVGLVPLLDWTRHFIALGAYTLLYQVSRLFKSLVSKLPPKQQYRWHRRLENWEFGSGSDFKL